MTAIEEALRTYLQPKRFETTDLEAGPQRRGPTFEKKLEAARKRSRAGFWICVGMILLLFAVVLLATYQFFDQLTNAKVGTVTSIFGVSATGAVLMMIRLSREATRADVLLTLLSELRDRDPDGFTRVITDLCNKWYGLNSVAGKE